MKVHVSTFLNASPTTVWSTVKRKELLHYVIAPMGKFSPLDGITRGAWISGTAYDGRSFMFSIIPVGTRTIFIECQETVFHQGDRQRCWRSLGKSDFRDLLTIDHGPTRE